LAQVKRYVLKQDKSGLVKEVGIYLAVSKEGISENPARSNKGKEVNEFLQSVNLKPGNEWCVAFCQWAYRTATDYLRVNLNMIKTGHSLTALSYARKFGFGKENEIKRGDWIIFQRGETNKGHCGIVLSKEGKIIYSIEGNTTSDDKKDNNQGVHKKIRNLNKFGWMKIVGFIGFE
jgi:hypothetical protein